MAWANGTFGAYKIREPPTVTRHVCATRDSRIRVVRPKHEGVANTPLSMSAQSPVSDPDVEELRFRPASPCSLQRLAVVISTVNFIYQLEALPSRRGRHISRLRRRLWITLARCLWHTALYEINAALFLWRFFTFTKLGQTLSADRRARDLLLLYVTQTPDQIYQQNLD